MLIGLGAGFRIIGSRYSPDTRRLREFAARNRLPHRWIDLEKDTDAEALLRELGVSPEETPVVIWRGHEVLRNPSNVELAKLFGLPLPRTDGRGLRPDRRRRRARRASRRRSTARRRDSTRSRSTRVATGGQAGTSSRIENYLGFPAGISGAELADRAVLQAEKFGAELTIPARADVARAARRPLRDPAR